MNDLVSIIVPVYNVEQYLRRCVDSLIEQTYRNLQIILVDDGSTDQSRAICDEYMNCDQRVEVIHKENGGSSSARKSGMDAVSGQYVMFLDGDDWLDENTVALCIACVNDDPEIGCVLFSYTKETESTSVPMHIMDQTQLLTGDEATDKIHRRLFGLSAEELNHPERMENVVSCCMKLYRTDYAKQGKYFDTALVGSCEDGLFNIYALHGCNRIFYLDQPLYHYRKRQNSLTKTFRPQLIDQWRTLFSVMDSVIHENNLSEKYREALNSRIALSITAIALNELSNPNHGAVGHIKVIRAYLKQKQYRAAVDRLDVSNMPAKWKLLLICSKKRWAVAVFCATKLISILLKRGK